MQRCKVAHKPTKNEKAALQKKKKPCISGAGRDFELAVQAFCLRHKKRQKIPVKRKNHYLCIMKKQTKKQTLSPGWYVFANWLIDVSKYLMTGVLLSTVFSDMEDDAAKLYIISAIACVGVLTFAVIIKNTEKK